MICRYMESSTGKEKMCRSSYKAQVAAMRYLAIKKPKEYYMEFKKTDAFLKMQERRNLSCFVLYEKRKEYYGSIIITEYDPFSYNFV